MFRSKALRPIAGVVLFTFTALTLQPLTAAAQLPSAPKAAPAQPVSGEERFSRTLNEIHEILKEVVPQSAMPHRSRGSTPEAAGKPGEKVLQAVGPKMRMESERAKPAPGIDITAKVRSLRGKYKELKSLEAEVSKGFKETEKHIRDKNLPAEILARHEAAAAEYDRRKAEFTALMDAVEAADDGKGGLAGALSSLGEFMAKYPNAKTHTPTDPNNLPWGSPKPVTRAPYTSPSQFKTSRLFGEPVKVAQAGSLSGISLPNTTLPLTPTPADTAPTEDVQITQAIRDLAASLGNAPVPIYNWVRNNIAFIPSYGSIQGSDMTLQTKRGNAFDTASLLIALLRAANIPSRYVYGTIEVPADKAMNWVGGVNVPQAAQNLLGQGGIPNIGVAQGGQIKSIRLEHVWVEAFVDYVPSRGAVNKTANTWVPLDASFKQYQYTQGMDIASNVTFDAQSFLTQVQQGATVNQAEGWTSNVDQTMVRQSLANYQTRVTDYINAQKPGATVGDLVGTQAIIADNRAILLGTLPYTRIATGAKFQTIPDNLRWKLQYNVYSNDFDRAMDDPSMSYTRSGPAVAGRKITLGYAPATPADQAVLQSFVPQPHSDGTPIQVSELPDTLPAYLIRLVPELRVDGQLVATGPAATMGSELIQNAALYDPARGWDPTADNRPTLGEYWATTFVSQTSAGLVSAAKARLEQLQSRIAAQDFAALRNSDVMGEILYSTLLTYFATAGANAEIERRVTKIVSYEAGAIGNFIFSASTLFSFGVPRQVSFRGLTIDIDNYRVTAVADDNDHNRTTTFMRYLGSRLSGLEHMVPEQALANSGAQQGISAMKALGYAAGLGQRIYVITDQNPDAINALQVSADLRSEIANAVGVGKRVTVHQSPIALNGWSGTGYIIEDIDTGAAAYKISGGANGGWLPILAAIAKIILGALFAAIAVMLIPVQILALVYIGLGAAFLIGLASLAAGLIAIFVFDFDPLMLAGFRAIMATILVFGLLAFGPAAVIAPIALALFMIWLLAILALELALALYFRRT